nr:mediator of RNA polymerase II transcription subunit 34 isoform X2 [Ipomoea trifida]
MQKEEFQHTAYATNAYVKVGPLAKQLLQGKKVIKLEVSNKQVGSSNFIKSSKRSRSSGLESMLDELRKELAAIHGSMFPHSVLSTQQMCTISMQKPDSVEELEKIIGKLKVEKYGSRILQEIKSYESKPEAVESVDGEQGASKKLKSGKKALVVIESSEEEL